MSTPSASVVIPAYNAERWLGPTLESFTRQTVTDFEVIVVDDGSQDGTVAIAESFRDRLDLTIIRGERSGAPARPSNVGTRAARSAFIVPCDADDLATPDRIERMQQAWEAVGRRDCLLFSDFSEIDEHGTLLKERVLPDYSMVARMRSETVSEEIELIAPEIGFEALLEGCFMRPCAAAMPKRVIERVNGFNERLRNGQDYDLYARISCAFPLVHVKRVLGLYRKSAGNISSRSPLRVAPSRILALQHLRKLTFTPKQAQLVRAGIAANYYLLGFAFREEGKIGASLNAYARAFYHRPASMHVRGMAGTLMKGLVRLSRPQPGSAP
jgi:glycosyltransferase involved in cell wall biosynthesis